MLDVPRVIQDLAQAQSDLITSSRALRFHKLPCVFIEQIGVEGTWLAGQPNLVPRGCLSVFCQPSPVPLDQRRLAALRKRRPFRGVGHKGRCRMLFEGNRAGRGCVRGVHTGTVWTRAGALRRCG